MRLPMLVLAALALAGGLIDVPALLGGYDGTPGEAAATGPMGPELFVVLAGMLGILLAYLSFAAGRDSPLPGWLAGPAGAGLGFDRLYDRLAVRPFLAAARDIREDPLDRPVQGLARGASGLHRWLSATQTGRLRWYASATALGGVALVGAMLLLAGWT